ncbi:MAG TPA: M1 family aminopeptidase [Kofleriaceae bacterium]
MRWVILSVVVACTSKSAPRDVAVTQRPQEQPSLVGYEPDGRGLRMPRVFMPTRYTATLWIDPAKPTFRGELTIVGDLERDSNAIWLHARDLEITKWSVSSYAGSAPQTLQNHGDRIELRGGFRGGPTTIQLAYEGKVDAKGIYGVFRQEHLDTAYVHSQFEPLHARRAFPCIDEPDRKTPWQLTIESPAGNIAVSNTEAIETKPLPDGSTRTTFAETKPLPSYLVAFGVGPFDIVDLGKSKAGVPLRIVTPRGTHPQTKVMADALPKLVDFFVEFFGVPYPYSKLDMVVLMSGGRAMENAGLISVDGLNMALGDSPSWQRLRDAVTLVSHEIAHQWLGDLVTPTWWDDTWLKEAFATWIENKATTAFEPSWQEADSASYRRYAFWADVQASAHSVRQPITSQNQIEGAYDIITYVKGSAVLDMYEHYVGPETFRRGLTAYLNAHAHGNATFDDFVKAIEKQTQKPLASSMKTFLEQPGLPVLSGRITCDGKPRIAITQRRYLKPGAAPATTTVPWQVPMCIVFEQAGKRAETCAMLDGNELALPSCPGWAMLNANSAGYYYVALDKAGAIALRDRAWPHLTAAERRAVFEDVRAQVSQGKLPVSLLVSFVPKLVAAGDRFSIELAWSATAALNNAVTPDLAPKLAAWTRKQFGPLAKQRGFLPSKGEGFDAEATRGMLVRIAANADDPKIVKQAIDLAKRYRELPESARDLVLPIAARVDQTVADRVRADMLVEADQAAKVALLSALAQIEDPKRAEATFPVIFDPKLTPRDLFNGFIFAPQRPASRRQLDRWMRANIAAILARLPTGDSLAGYLTYGIWTCEAAERDAAVQFLQTHFSNVAGGPKLMRERIEQIDQCIAERAVILPSIREWLRTAR